MKHQGAVWVGGHLRQRIFEDGRGNAGHPQTVPGNQRLGAVQFLPGKGHHVFLPHLTHLAIAQ